MHTKTLPRHARTGVLAAGWRKARTGEIEGELYPVWPILGAAEEDGDQDGDQDGDTDKDGDQDGDTGDTDTGDDEGADDEGADDEGADDLGDAGKQALDRMKAKLKAERGKRREAEAERDRLKTSTDEADPQRIRTEAETAATAKANARIVRSEVKAAATGKLANPADALVFLDLGQFEVDEDGEVDEDDVATAIEDLIKARPYLAAATPKRFQGSGDGGARKGSAGPKQLTERDIKKLSPEQIEAARVAGQLRDYLAG